MKFTGLSTKVIGCAIEVHRELGPGLLESTYQRCLAHELRLAGISFEIEHPQPVSYKGLELECGYRIDLLIENQIVVELKAVAELLPIHDAQLITYLKLSKLRRGYLMNFNVPLLKAGLKSFLL